MIVSNSSTRDQVHDDSMPAPLDRVQVVYGHTSGNVASCEVTLTGATQAVVEPTVPSPMTTKTDFVNSRCSAWLASLVYPLGRHVLMPLYFRSIEVIGRENLPVSGPVILAPTHRSRWDALMIPYAAGQDLTGRELRFMVTIDEVKGLQGWLIRHLGGFPINTRHPEIASLRHGIEILQGRETLVIFPEGGNLRENRMCSLNKLHPGLARLAIKAEGSQANLGIQIVPIATYYDPPSVPWRSSVKIQIGKPLNVAHYCVEAPKEAAKKLTADLQNALHCLMVE